MSAHKMSCNNVQSADESFVIHRSVTDFLEAEKKREQGSAETSPPKHPAVSFYLGELPMKVMLTGAGVETELSVVELHLRLLPPAGGFDSDDERCADASQIETTKRNWHVLVTSLLPSFHCFSQGGPRLAYSSWVALRKEPGLMDRMHYSYSVVLHFYGWRLHDQRTGALDRHKNWRTRYLALQEDPDASKYYSYITWIIRHLLEFLMTSYAHRFGLFLLEEFGCGRLLQLRPSWERYWRPMLDGCLEIEDTAKQQLRKREMKLDQSDSD